MSAVGRPSTQDDSGRTALLGSDPCALLAYVLLMYGSAPGTTFEILLVCTGNICRSSLGERLGRAYLDRELGDAAGSVRLTSAGTAAVVGSQMHPHSAVVLRGLGGEPGDFRARQLSEDLTDRADLVLCMTRAHRRRVLMLAPRALARTFTLLEAADLVGRLSGDLLVPDLTFPDRARELVREMGVGRSHRRSSAADEVPDPMGLPIEEHQRTGEVVAEAVTTILSRLVALHPDDVPRTPSRRSGPSHRLGG